MDPADVRFAWHPRYQRRILRQVRDELTAELARDQRAYALAMEGAEEHEQETLASVLELEKKWGGFDLDWATADAPDLAATVAAFEHAREERRELIPYADYRSRRDGARAATDQIRAQSSSPAAWLRLSQSRAPLLVLLLVVVLIIVIVVIALS